MARQAKRSAAAAPAAPTDFFIGRDRLFARLDQLSGRAVWLQGPTGAGKTVLLRTYVQRCNEPVLWLAIDATSTTPDALFNSLTQAAQRAGVEELPQFAGEHRQAPAELLRLCAERIAHKLPGAIVVVDDAQRLLPALASLLTVLIDACCTDLRLLFAAQDWPIGLEQHIASAKLVVVGHEQLAFDETEANELARRVGAADDLARAMRERTSGWAAGLMLSLQLGQGATTANAQRRLEGPLASLVHDGVLAGVEPETVKALAALAPARYVPIELAKLGPPWTRAVNELERLGERGLFVDRKENGDLRLHDLLCSALRQAATNDTDRGAAVAALSKIDRCELALACIVAASDCSERLQHWLAKHGDALLMRADIGMLADTVLHCGAELPPEVLFWCSRGALAIDLGLADVTAERAFSTCVPEAGTALMRRCCGLGLVAQTVLLDAGRLETWQARLSTLPAASPDEITQAPLLEGSARLVAHVLQPWRPNTPEVLSLHSIMREALFREQPSQEAILAASVLVFALLQLQRRLEAPALLSQLEATLWFSRAPSHSKIEWHINKGYTVVGLGRLEAAAASFASAAKLAREQGLNLLLRDALGGLARTQLMVGALAVAEDVLNEAEAMPGEPGVHRRVDELCLRAWLELERQRPLRALSSLETAERLLTDNGVTTTAPLERAMVHVLYAMGRQSEALELAEKYLRSSEGSTRDLIECDFNLLTGLSLWNRDPITANEALQRGVELIEQRRWTSFLLLLPHEAGLVANRALEIGNGTLEVIRDSIRERRLPAPPDAGARWPWPLRIFLFGVWRIERFDEAMEFTGKVQRKPLELLKFLACARGQQADHASVCSALWPDADTGAARRSLEVATSRLREMLGSANWVRVTDGRTRLDMEFVWCDAQALWRACSAAESVRGGSHASLVATAKAMLSLYQSSLLTGDEDSPWLLGARERLRTVFVRAVRAVSAELQGQGHLDVAIDLLERGFEAEPLAEELAQRLMQAQLEQGRPTEAMRTYRKMRQMLSVLLGAAPSPSSEKLRQAIQSQPQGGTTHEQRT